MGDRKRFLNYIIFLTETDTTSEKNEKKRRREQVRRKNSLKFGSSRSMKRVLDNIKSIPIMRNRSRRRWTTLHNPKRNHRSQRGRKTNPATKVKVKGTGTVQLLSATPQQEKATNVSHFSRRCLRIVREVAARM